MSIGVNYTDELLYEDEDEISTSCEEEMLWEYLEHPSRWSEMSYYRYSGKRKYMDFQPTEWEEFLEKG